MNNDDKCLKPVEGKILCGLPRGHEGKCKRGSETSK